MAFLAKIPSNVIKRALKEAPLNKPRIFYSSSSYPRRGPSGRSNIIGAFRVIRDKKMIVVSYANKALDLFSAFSIVVFPKPEDQKHFRRALKSVREDGPAEINPGSVGSILIYKQLSSAGEENLNIKHIQSHFLTKRKTATGKKPSVKETHGLPRNIASKYAGWRIRAITEAIRIAEREGKKLFIKDVFYYADEQKAGIRTFLLREIDSACKALGLEKITDDYIASGGYYTVYASGGKERVFVLNEEARNPTPRRAN